MRLAARHQRLLEPRADRLAAIEPEFAVLELEKMRSGSGVRSHWKSLVQAIA